MTTEVVPQAIKDIQIIRRALLKNWHWQRSKKILWNKCMILYIPITKWTYLCMISFGLLVIPYAITLPSCVLQLVNQTAWWYCYANDILHSLYWNHFHLFCYENEKRAIRCQCFMTSTVYSCHSSTGTTTSAAMIYLILLYAAITVSILALPLQLQKISDKNRYKSRMNNKTIQDLAIKDKLDD